MEDSYSRTILSLFMTDNIEKLFDCSFIAQVSVDQMKLVILSLVEKNGAIISVTPQENKFVIDFENGRVYADASFDDEGRITGLWFGVSEKKVAANVIVSEIEGLPGVTSVLVTCNDDVLFCYNANVAMSVASTAKLVILHALNNMIDAGALRWDQVVLLDASWKSVPSGILQNWPDGTSITIETLANLMISASDNTATDALIHLIGRDKLESLSPQNDPFLTSREIVMLKNRYRADQEGIWSSKSNAEKKLEIQILDTDDVLDIKSAVRWSPPQIGWMMTATDIHNLFKTTHHLPALKINKGVIVEEDWKEISFKGGSDTGALCLAARVADENDNSYSIIAIWNDTAQLDELKFVSLYTSLVSNLARRSDELRHA